MSQLDKYIKIARDGKTSEEVILESVTFVRVNEFSKNNSQLKKFLPIGKPVHIGVDEESVYVSHEPDKLGAGYFDKKLKIKKVDNVIDFYAVLFDNIQKIEKLDKSILKEVHYIDGKINVYKTILDEPIAIANLDGIEEIYFVN